MIAGKKIVVVMPAYNAERTLERTWREVVELDMVDLVIVVDDASQDQTLSLARRLPKVMAWSHPSNRGYGANQKTCYRLALDHGADIVVMIHPDYQYTPRVLPAMVALVASGLYPCVLGSRILGGQALEGGMPVWRYVANRCLTLVENILLGTKVSEFHTGYRAFSRELLERLPLDLNSDDFVFDNEVVAEAVWLGCRIGEVSCPTRYAPDASSISFSRCISYGIGCLTTACAFRLSMWGMIRSHRFPRESWMRCRALRASAKSEQIDPVAGPQ
jgi:glycosyltransferase involved in cell wall biosynthesis